MLKRKSEKKISLSHSVTSHKFYNVAFPFVFSPLQNQEKRRRRIKKMSTNTMETENREQERLKHLGFVRVTAINTLICISSLYEYAKQHSGPLRSGVQKVEGTVISAVSPVCEKFKDVPEHILVFLDHKVDQAEDIFDKNAPTLVKKLACQGCSMIHKASELTQRLVHESQTRGISAAASCAVKTSKTYISEQTVNAWFALNQFSTFRAVAKVTVPKAAQLSDKYNHMVTDMSNKGYTVFSYLPLVPINRIAKAFERREVAVAGKETSDREDPAATKSEKKSD